MMVNGYEQNIASLTKKLKTVTGLLEQKVHSITSRPFIIKIFFITLHTRVIVRYCDEYVCVCVCLSVCEDISGTTRTMFTKFLCMLHMAVAQSFSSVVAIHYVLLVLWMTSCFFL